MSDRYHIIAQLEQEELLKQDPATSTRLFQELRALGRDPQWLQGVDKDTLDRLILVFISLDNSPSQLDLVATLANILYMNGSLRHDPHPEMLRRAIPKLCSMLELVSERRFNSESEYKDFLPIFRLYFFLSHNKELLPTLKESVLKISGKLLNFVTLSSLESSSLNNVIVEILKILYSDVHQLEDTTGIDSYFVLSCNKFNLLYAKCEETSEDYDNILEHFGNVLMAISTDVSQNYMLNKMLFVRNQVRLLNKELSNQSSHPRSTLVQHLLTLDILLQIDNRESGLEQHIKENLNFEALNLINADSDPHLPTVLSDLECRLDSSADLTALLQPTAEYQHQSTSQVTTPNTNVKTNLDDESTRPRFEDLTEEEQDNEIHQMQDLFDRIQNNGVFDIKMK